MVQRVQIVLEDDFDGGAADETIRFGLDGATYEIDLSDANAAKLRETVDPWLTVARKTKGRRSRPATRTRSGSGGRSGSGSGMSRQELADVRAWAKANGYQVSDRGRIPASVQDAYRKAHNT